MCKKDFSEELLANTVPAKEQLAKGKSVTFYYDEDCDLRVLFVGNSITKHAPKSEIGWNNDWGMAASAIDKDYVHIIVNKLKEKHKKIGYCIAQGAEWERNYWNSEVLDSYQDARDFNADIVIIRIGENIIRDRLCNYNFKTSFEKMVKYFSPNSKSQVIITTLFWQAEVLDKPICEVAAENHYALAEIGDLGEMDEMKALGLFDHYGVSIHPGDLGMLKIADRIINLLK